MQFGTIYKIINKETGLWYVGQSTNFKVRKTSHIRELRKGTHHSIYLQNTWNKYGEDSFEFEETHPKILVEYLNKVEEYYIDQKPNYNLSDIANVNSILPYDKEVMQFWINEYYETDHTADTLAKKYNVSVSIIRELVYNKAYERHNFTFPENYKQIKKSKSGGLFYRDLLTDEEIQTIRWLAKYCHYTTIADHYGIYKSNIIDIVENKNNYIIKGELENQKILDQIPTKSQIHYERYEIRRKDKSPKTKLQKELISMPHEERIGKIKWLLTQDLSSTSIWQCFGIAQSTLSRIRNNKINVDILPIQCPELIGSIKKYKNKKENRSANKQSKTKEHITRNGNIKWLKDRCSVTQIRKYFNVSESTVQRLHVRKLGFDLNPIPCPHILEEIISK